MPYRALSFCHHLLWQTYGYLTSKLSLLRTPLAMGLLSIEDPMSILVTTQINRNSLDPSWFVPVYGEPVGLGKNTSVTIPSTTSR